MSLKRSLILLFLLLAPLPATAGNLYPMECGDLRRENRNLNPSPLKNPLQTQWTTSACVPLQDPVSNPVVLSDRVVQAFVGGVRCYDRTTGAHLWTWPCNPATSIYNAPTFDGGRNLLYVGCSNGDSLALDPQTGNVVWTYNHLSNPYPMQYASPMYAGGKLYVGDGGSGFLCMDPDTRQTIWRFDFTTYSGMMHRDAICTPAYDNGFIYLSTSNGDLFSLDATTGAVQWHVKQSMIHENSPLLSNEYVYTLGKLSQVECRSRADGSLVWAADTHTVFGQTNGNMALCGDILIVPGDSWRVWGLNRYNGVKVWSTQLTGNFALNSAFVVCGKVYLSACHGDYYSLDGQTGQIEWRLRHQVELTFVGWAEADGQLFVANKTGRMTCFTSVVPGNPVSCVCNLSATPVANYTPSPAPTGAPLVNPNCPNTPTNTFTPTATPTGTLTASNTPTITWTPSITPSPTPSLTPTPTFTPAPTSIPTPVYANTDTAVALALGVPVNIVDEARQLNLGPDIVYIILRLTHYCGCHPHDIMVLRLNMGWDDIANYYGVNWITLVNEVNNLTANLLPENTTVNDILRNDANDPTYFPVVPTPTPVAVGMPLNLLPPTQGGVCP